VPNSAPTVAADHNQPKQQPQTGIADGIADADVPERPALAPNVELSGEMQEGGFEDQQWLVQRDGRFIQITELLYRVAEQANGQRSLDEVAEGVAATTGRGVSVDNVRQLLVEKLIPMGLIAKADGTVAETAGDETTRGPLSVNMRMKMVGPELTERVTGIFTFLFAPPVLIVVLLLAALGHVWLYFVHGVGGGLLRAIYTPGLLLVVLAIIVVSTAWHEFGHAAALRYGGGRVRGMGVGLYIAYPAFYTDVTDAYRLGRWGKVRTDLGGFYFNLIFALGMMGLYALTGWEVLLLVVVLINVDIIRQMLPFVRLDGYWTLADLTGIPDFFSQIGPFLRTVLPLPWWKGSTLPDFMGWVKAVFALYIVVTIPLLLGLLFFLITSLPDVLATTWDSLQQQADAFSAARAETDILGMTAAGVQSIILALPTVGLVFLLWKLGRRAAIGLWRWSTPTPARRAAGSFAALAAAALAIFLWAPTPPFLGNDSGTAADAGVGTPTAGTPATLATATAQPNVSAEVSTTTTANNGFVVGR